MLKLRHLPSPNKMLPRVRLKPWQSIQDLCTVILKLYFLMAHVSVKPRHAPSSNSWRLLLAKWGLSTIPLPGNNPLDEPLATLSRSLTAQEKPQSRVWRTLAPATYSTAAPFAVLSLSFCDDRKASLLVTCFRFTRISDNGFRTC